ncbi:MAG: hypothetical protein JNJ57_11655 [Saprospiraceae bacterium]|nr:hypothetical protein [Saprospiraceae bacterium]
MIRKGVVDLEAVGEPGEEPEFTSFAEVEFLEQLLFQLEPNCQKLIRLKYLEEMRDKEVIELQLTQYSTVDALKNHRSKCFKKLTELANDASMQ